MRERNNLSRGKITAPSIDIKWSVPNTYSILCFLKQNQFMRDINLWFGVSSKHLNDGLGPFEIENQVRIIAL